MYLCMKYCHVSITTIAVINCNTITRAGGCFCPAPLSSPMTCGFKEMSEYRWLIASK